MLVYSNRAVLGDCLSVLGQLELYSTGLAMLSSNHGLGVIPGDLLSFNCLLLALTFLHFGKSSIWWSNSKLPKSYSANCTLLLWKVQCLSVPHCTAMLTNFESVPSPHSKVTIIHVLDFSFLSFKISSTFYIWRVNMAWLFLKLITTHDSLVYKNLVCTVHAGWMERKLQKFFFFLWPLNIF